MIDDSDARVARVRRALAALGHTGDVLVMRDSTHTAEMAAAAAGCELGQIVKTLALYVSGEPLLALVAGDRRLDDRMVAQRFGVGRKQVKLAGAEQVLELTDYPIGGVCPFALPRPLRVIADASLTRYEVVWSAGGSANAIFPISLQELIKFTGGELIELSA